MSRFSRYGSSRNLRSRRYINESYFSNDEILEHVYYSAVNYIEKNYPYYSELPTLEPYRAVFYLDSEGFGPSSTFAKNLMRHIVGALEEATEGNYEREGFDVFIDDEYLIIDLDRYANK